MGTAAVSDGAARVERLVAELAAADARIAQAAGGLAPLQLQWRPPEGGWGIGDVLEHLLASNEDYLARLRVLVAEGARGTGAPVRADRPGGGADGWRPSLMGGFLARSLRATRKLPAPKIWRPASAPRADALERFLAGEREIARLLRDSLDLDWRRTRLASPVSRLVRFNLGDAFEILAAHSSRHAGQVERVRARRDFPEV
jgi:hypothetical protein